MYTAVSAGAPEVRPTSAAFEDRDDEDEAAADEPPEARPQWLRALSLLGAGLLATALVICLGVRSRAPFKRVGRHLDVQLKAEEVPLAQFEPVSKVVVNAESDEAAAAQVCPGSINLGGFGEVSLVGAKWDVPGEPARYVRAPSSKTVEPHMKGRAYFASSCAADSFDSDRYVALPLLGRTLRYTVDLSGAGCGCNAALYLTSMQQNPEASDCGDFYCDANSVCGVRCAEVDIQEANKYAWYSTLHVADDGGGVGGGYGTDRREWTPQQYAPGGECVDTSEPFQVAVSFPVDESGGLQAMEVQLSQEGHPCKLESIVDAYMLGDRDGMAEVSQALAAGMTPIISYWSSDDMLWMDGKGDGEGPCETDVPSACSEFVRFSDFSVADIGQPPPPPPPPPAVVPAPPAPQEALPPPQVPVPPAPPAPPAPQEPPAPPAPQEALPPQVARLPPAAPFGAAPETPMPARAAAAPAPAPAATPLAAQPAPPPTGAPARAPPAPTKPPVAHTPAPSAPRPTPAPTTPAPTPAPSWAPTAGPTAEPTEGPTAQPTPPPTVAPQTPQPTVPAPEPSTAPLLEPAPLPEAGLAEAWAGQGFCCLAGQGGPDSCSACWRGARAAVGDRCGGSEGDCNACGWRWCLGGDERAREEPHPRVYVPHQAEAEQASSSQAEQASSSSKSAHSMVMVIHTTMRPLGAVNV